VNSRISALESVGVSARDSASALWLAVLVAGSSTLAVDQSLRTKPLTELVKVFPSVSCAYRIFNPPEILWIAH